MSFMRDLGDNRVSEMDRTRVPTPQEDFFHTIWKEKSSRSRYQKFIAATRTAFKALEKGNWVVPDLTTKDEIDKDKIQKEIDKFTSEIYEKYMSSSPQTESIRSVFTAVARDIVIFLSKEIQKSGNTLSPQAEKQLEQIVTQFVLSRDGLKICSRVVHMLNVGNPQNLRFRDIVGDDDLRSLLIFIQDYSDRSTVYDKDDIAFSLDSDKRAPLSRIFYKVFFDRNSSRREGLARAMYPHGDKILDQKDAVTRQLQDLLGDEMDKKKNVNLGDELNNSASQTRTAVEQQRRTQDDKSRSSVRKLDSTSVYVDLLREELDSDIENEWRTMRDSFNMQVILRSYHHCLSAVQQLDPTLSAVVRFDYEGRLVTYPLHSFQNERLSDFPKSLSYELGNLAEIFKDIDLEELNLGSLIPLLGRVANELSSYLAYIQSCQAGLASLTDGANQVRTATSERLKQKAEVDRTKEVMNELRLKIQGEIADVRKKIDELTNLLHAKDSGITLRDLAFISGDVTFKLTDDGEIVPKNNLVS